MKIKNINVETDRKEHCSFKLERSLKVKLEKLATLENMNLSKFLNQLIKNYLEEKEAYNNYLERSDSFLIQLPSYFLSKKVLTGDLNYDLKIMKTESQIYNYLNKKIDLNKAFSLQEIVTKTITFEVSKITNNLDVYDIENNTYRAFNDDCAHEGLEFLIMSKLEGVKHNFDDFDFIENDFTNYLYVLYFKTNREKQNRKGFYNTKVYLISFLKALELIKQSNNNYLYNLAINIKQDLEKAESIEEIETLANKYNSKNIVDLQDKQIEKLQPIKLTTFNNKYIIKQHDEDILKRLDNLEKQIKEKK